MMPVLLGVWREHAMRDDGASATAAINVFGRSCLRLWWTDAPQPGSKA